MFYWLQRSKKTVSAHRARNRVRLTLETLESRNCPSSVQITSFNASIVQGNTVLVTGTATVSGSPGANISLTFNGAVSGSTSVDQNGNFSYQAPASSTGAVYASASDPSGDTGQGETYVTDMAPSISFGVTGHGPNKTVTITGQVSGSSPAGLTVTLSGVVSGPATTNSSGSFTYTGSASALGQVTATVTDAFGESGTESEQFTDSPPTISNFQATYASETGTWTFSGQVMSVYADGMTVTLNGLPGIGSATTTVGSDGTFVYDVLLPPTWSGPISAVTTDPWGEVSNTAITYVR